MYVAILFFFLISIFQNETNLAMLLKYPDALKGEKATKSLASGTW